jgi:hypothetical protein
VSAAGTVVQLGDDGVEQLRRGAGRMFSEERFHLLVGDGSDGLPGRG